MTLQELKMAATYDRSVSTQTASFNQYNLPELPGGEICLSENVFNHLIELGTKRPYGEDGTFIYGTEYAPNKIFLSECSSVEDYDIKLLEYKPSKNMEAEYHKKAMDNTTDVIVHFHTHPPYGYWRRLSDYDLFTLAKLQIHNQPKNSAKRISYFACLFSKGKHSESDRTINVDHIGNETDDQLTFVFYDANVNMLYKVSKVRVFLNKNDIRDVNLLTTEVAGYYKKSDGGRNR